MKFFKRIAVVLFAVLLTMANLPMTANAATEGTTTTIDKTYRCVKNSDTGIAGTAPIGDSRYYWHYNAAGTALNSPIRFMKEKGTSMPVYCIEMGATFESSNFSTEKLTDSKFWNSLSATAQRGITYATMYGYPVNNFGAANCDAYVATQTIIWEFQKGYRTLSGRSNATLYNLMIKGSPADTAYNKLAAAITAHSTHPSFSFNTSSKAQASPIELKYDSASKTWAVTLTDSNGVLSGYSVSSDGGLDVSKLENTLTIRTENPISESAQIILERPLPTKGQSLLALYSTVNQNCIIGQLQDPVTSYISIETEAVDGRVSVTKENEKGEKLAGVVFGVYSDEACTKKITEMTTDSRGTAISGDISIKEYPVVYVKELSVTDDQKKLYSINSTVYKVNLKAGETVSANGGNPVINKWLTGKISVSKITPSKMDVEGAVFKAYLDAELKMKAKDINGKPVVLTTDKNGNAVSENINMDANGTKKLYVVETEIITPIGQALVVSDTVYEVTLIPNKTVPINGGEPIVNEWYDGKLSLTKTNENGEPLEGVVFGVYDDPECTKLTIDAYGYEAVYTTDRKGYILSEDIAVERSTGTRTVYVKEIKITEEQEKLYSMNPTVYKVEIKPAYTVKVNDGNPIINNWLHAKLSVHKTTSDGKPLSGAQFSVFADENCTVSLTDISGEPIVITTDEKGNAVSGEIYVGKTGSRMVYVKETALDNPNSDILIINPTVFSVVLKPNETVPINDGEPVINEYKPGKLSLLKTNENGDPLEGAVFGVYDDQECTKLTSDINGRACLLTTDEKGSAISADILMNRETGDRMAYIKELSIPVSDSDVYSVNTNVFKVTLKPAQTVSVNDGKPIVNKWLPATLSLVKTDEDGNNMGNVVFGVFGDEDCTEKITEIITDKNGCASSSEIKVSKDGTRTVYVKELSMTESDSDIYELNTKVYTVKLNAGQNSEVNGGNAIVNKFKTVPVKIRKSDFTTAEGVVGAVIEIYDSTGKLVYKGVTLEDGNTEEIELRVGSYTFMETIAPAGYVLNKTVFEFTVNPNKTVTGSCEVTDKPTEWTITKTDLTTAEPIAGAEITIYDADGNEVFKEVTKEDGTVTAFYLPTGTYKFKETTAPEGYVLNEEVFTFTVDEEGHVTGENSITNRRIIGSIKVLKIDEDTGEHLAGAVFGLFSADGKIKLADGTTGEDGTVTFADLEYGDYVIKELDAPVGFMMRATEFRVNIRSDGKTITLEVSNTREPIVPKTGDSTLPIILVVILFLSSGAAMFLLIRSKTHKQTLIRRKRK